MSIDSSKLSREPSRETSIESSGESSRAPVDPREQWSNYWRQGHLTSLPCGFAANYDGEFLQFWNRQFALAGDAGSVLDVCSGNGSIALLAQDYSFRNKRELRVTATDAADINVAALLGKNPSLAQYLQAIRFLPNTLLEELSEQAASVDLVTSQYGIEYTDWEIAASRVYRLLKPGGYFSMICHAVDSKISMEMARMQRDYARLLDVDILCREPEFENSTKFPKRFIRQLDQALDTLYVIFKQDRSSDILSSAGSHLEKIRQLALKDFSAGLQSFSRFRQGLLTSYATSTDLLAVIQRLQQAPEWYKVFSETGLQLLESGDIHYHTGERAGKSYQFRKPA